MNGWGKGRVTGILLTAALLICGGVLCSYAADLRTFQNVKWTDHPANDGDSFFLESDKKSFHVRLYFVDCPETSAGSKSDARRVREQTRYFGLPRAERVIDFGGEAKAFVEDALRVRSIINLQF